MPSTSLAARKRKQDVDGRDKPGHDEMREIGPSSETLACVTVLTPPCRCAECRHAHFLSRHSLYRCGLRAGLRHGRQRAAGRRFRACRGHDRRFARQFLHRHADRARPRAHRRALRAAGPRLQARAIRRATAAILARHIAGRAPPAIQPAEFRQSSRHRRCGADQARRAGAEQRAGHFVQRTIRRGARRPFRRRGLWPHRARQRQDRRHLARGEPRRHRPARKLADPPRRSGGQRPTRRAWRLHR